MHVVLNSGFSPARWQKGLTAMTEKKPGVILIDKLRAILLMEADFNFGNKMIFGSRAMHSAEVSEMFRHEICGGRKKMEAAEAGLARRLFLDTLRQQRRGGAIASVDAQTCYNRIVHSIASLCFQRMGVPTPVIATMFEMTCNVRFFLCTACGDSDISFGGTKEDPFQGVQCQGNGGGPVMHGWQSVLFLSK